MIESLALPGLENAAGGNCITTRGAEASGLDGFGAVRAVFENRRLVIVSKPAGLETVADGGEERDFTRLVRDELAEPGLVPVHRLDRDTSGAQMFARDPAAEKSLTALFRKREVEKTYLALCLGVPRNRTGTINRNLTEWQGGRRPVRVVRQGGLPAATAYEVLAAGGAEGLSVSLLAFYPHQGRTHQIRVHAASLGYPVLGDDQYGERPANLLAKRLFGLKRQALHSWRLEFSWEGGRIAAEVPLPPDIRAAAEGLNLPLSALLP